MLIQEAERLIYNNDPHGFDHHRMVAVKLANLAEEIRVSTPDGPYGRPSNPRTREAESLNSDWEFMATRIKSRLWSTMDRLPSDQQWERSSSMVVSNLDQAVKHVDLLLSYPSLPTRTKRTAAFQSASHYLTSARSYLIDLSR